MWAIQRPLDDLSQVRVRLEAEAVLGVLAHCRAGGADLISSDALAFESGRNPHPLRRAFADGVLAGAAVRQPLTPAAVARAADLEAAGCRPLDALHLASAGAAGADFFCTCDDRLLRRARAIAVLPLRAVSPIELVGELGL
jgi:hypothetical protein